MSKEPIQLALEAGIPVKTSRDGATHLRCTEATYDYLMAEHAPIELPVSCNCAQRPYPHLLSVHRKAYAEKPGAYEVWDGKQETVVRFAPEGKRWPWSLAWIGAA